MCLILIGKSASGKTTIRDILTMKHGFHSIVTYTTRPMRKGEISDVTYHYISNEEFLKKIDEDFLLNGRNIELVKVFGIMGQQKKILKMRMKSL